MLRFLRCKGRKNNVFKLFFCLFEVNYFENTMKNFDKKALQILKTTS